MEIELTSQNFEKEVLKSKIPVLVDFWAQWCSPCKMMLPVVEELAKEYEGKIKVGKVNIEKEPDLAQKYSVLSIPTFMIFKKGKVVSSFMGAQAKEKIIEEIEKALASG